jgi:hypothetical protein
MSMLHLALAAMKLHPEQQNLELQDFSIQSGSITAKR